jgi:hypothetical protein
MAANERATVEEPLEALSSIETEGFGPENECVGEGQQQL